MAKKKKNSSSKDKERKGIIPKEEKEELINDLKKTMHDLGRLPAVVMAPVIAYISSKYEKIPKKRREQLQKIAGQLKENGEEGMKKLKEWFQGVSEKAVKKGKEKAKEALKDDEKKETSDSSSNDEASKKKDSTSDT